MRKSVYLILLIFFVFIVVFLWVKINTVIYIGDYSGNTRYAFDIRIKIDEKEILNDSLKCSFPYQVNFILKEKLRYGLHKINIYSDKANINQEKTLFLLPNQFVYIEFIPADTLTFSQYNFPDSLYINGTELTDSIIEQYKPPLRYYNSLLQDTLDFHVFNEKSSFDIRTEFNPFYLE